jgi:hypothetical protein
MVSVILRRPSLYRSNFPCVMYTFSVGCIPILGQRISLIHWINPLAFRSATKTNLLMLFGEQ